MKWIYIIFIHSFIGFSQETMSLQNSIDLVLLNEAHFIPQNAEFQRAAINRKFHPWSILPITSANTNLSTSFGRRVDPFTNTFTASQVNSQSIGLSSSMPLFNGFNYFYQKQIYANTLLQKELTIEQKKNELILSTIDEFIEICQLQIQTELTQLRIVHYQNVQLTQKLLLSEGKISAIDTLKSHNSILNEQLELSKIESQYSAKAIRFNFKMNVPLTNRYQYDVPSIAKLETKPVLSDEFQLKLLEATTKITENELKSAHSQNLPSISLSGNIGTGFSTNNKDYNLDGNPTKPYQRQVNQNLYEGVGVYLSIPILNRGTWFKETQINRVKLTEIEQSKSLSQHNLQISKMENELNVINKAVEISILERIVNNLEIISAKLNLLYKEGKISYIDLETSYLDWELKKLELARSKLEHEKRKLFLY